MAHILALLEVDSLYKPGLRNPFNSSPPDQALNLTKPEDGPSK